MGRRGMLVYGSQTGQSEAISEQLLVTSLEQDLDLEMVCAVDIVMEDLYMPDQVVVFVVSSTGEGDPPENFEQFWVDLHDKPPSQLHYALLGLGDTNYTEYGGFPTKLNQYLTDSGAKEFYKFEVADDAVGLELVVEPWIEGLWEPLRDCLENVENGGGDSGVLNAGMIRKLNGLKITRDNPNTNMMYTLEFEDADFTESLPFGVDTFILPFAEGKLETSEVINKQRLNAVDDRVKHALEFELSTCESYGPGDSFGMLCANSDSEVNELLNVLKLRENAHLQYKLTPKGVVKPRFLPKHVLLKCCPYYALKYTLDLHSLPKKAFLKYLSECCVDKTEADFLFFLSSKEGSSDLNEIVYKQNLTLLEILRIVPSCTPSFAGLLQFLPRLMPRYYSISRISTSSIKFVFNVIDNIRGSVEKLPPIPGVCTSWLSSLEKGSKLHIYRRKNEHFKPRADSPLIMIGAGTGVSPYLGFLDHLEKHPTNVTTILITGNRYQQLDSIYSNEFEAHHDTGTLVRYLRVFSRENDNSCRYVQDMLRQHATDIIEVVDEGAVVYVCGDAKGLGVGVYKTFRDILAMVRGCEDEDADLMLQDMKQRKIYVEDIWS